MNRNIGNTYQNVTVKLDNNEFTDCKFFNCLMEYSGLGPASIYGCQFVDVQWVFAGPAQNTLQFMHAVYHGMGDGGRKLIEQTFENIKKPGVPHKKPIQPTAEGGG
jgi:hypothetical protein